MPTDARAALLSSDQLQQFQAQGFIVLPQFASAAFCQQVVDYAQQQLAAQVEPIEYEADTRYPGAPASREAEGGQTARRLLRAYAREPLLADFAASGALAAILRQLLGPDALLSQAHHNCIMTKQARYSTATGWHRDSRYWQFQRAELISSWLALRQETPENGCLLVIPGSHRVEVDSHQLDAAQFLRTDLEDNQALLAQAQTVPLNAGDLLLFHSNLFHAAGRNQTGSTKLSLVFTYR
ncbi:MAG: hypothetical protein RL748_697, partial [Pseudomonadota bacterium]